MNKQRIIELKAMPYEEYLKTPEWNALRERILERDAHRCRVCNTDKELHVHHRTYVRRGHEDTNDLTTLCQVCHEAFHKRPQQTNYIGTPDQKIYDKQEAKQRATKRWEEYLIWLLVRNPKLYPYVSGILSENDFADTDVRALYNLLNTASLVSSNQTFEQLLPSSGLEPVMARITESIASKFPITDLVQVKEAITVCARIKRANVVQSVQDLKIVMQSATDSGDTVMLRQIQQKVLAAHQQLRTIDSAVQLQG